MASGTEVHSSPLLIFAPKPGERLKYAFNLLFDCLLKVPFRIIGNRREFENAEGPKLNYSGQKISEDAFFVPAGPLLFEKGIQEQVIEVRDIEGLPAFFHQAVEKADISFDLPALVFYLASRYEEYLPFSGDRFGRFPASESLAFRQNFLQRPLANEWAIKLGQLLKHKFPELAVIYPKYRFQPSYDVDMAWAYLYKSFFKNMAGYLRLMLLGRKQEFKHRFIVQNKKAPDPYFTFPYLDQLNETWKLEPLYFFLMGASGRYDRNTNSRHPAFSRLVENTGAKYALGIHPSFSSNIRKELQGKELARLEKMCDRSISASRQHFLMLRLPLTYQRLLNAGIRHDYSMGYAAQTGFRASVAQPFPWYDLQREEETALIVHPFQLMDVTLKNYLSLSPDQAIEKAKELIEITKGVGGVFSSIWHNSSFSTVHGWGGWKEVYEAIVEMAIEADI